MKVKLSRYAILILAIFCMGVYLPSFIFNMFPFKASHKSIEYSPITHDFISVAYDYKNNKREIKYFDSRQEEISKKEFTRLLPFRFARDLVKWGQLPEKINGQPLSYQQILRNIQWEQYRPVYFPENHARVQLFSLFEAGSEYSKLEYPADVFRIRDRMEFINADTNIVNEEKSELYTEALNNKAFSFPAKLISGGEASCHKPLDEGYLITDQADRLFHLKQVNNKPYIREIQVPEDVKIRSLSLVEHDRKEFYGYAISDKNELYQIQYRRNQMIKVPLENYNPETMRLRMRYTPQNAIASYSDRENEYITVLDKHYNVIKTYHEKDEATETKSFAYQAIKSIFPYYISVQTSYSNYFQLELRYGKPLVRIVFILISLGLAIGLMKLRGISIRDNVSDLVLIGLTGVYGLIATQLIPPEKWS